MDICHREKRLIDSDCFYPWDQVHTIGQQLEVMWSNQAVGFVRSYLLWLQVPPLNQSNHSSFGSVTSVPFPITTVTSCPSLNNLAPDSLSPCDNSCLCPWGFQSLWNLPFVDFHMLMMSSCSILSPPPTSLSFSFKCCVFPTSYLCNSLPLVPWTPQPNNSANPKLLSSCPSPLLSSCPNFTPSLPRSIVEIIPCLNLQLPCLPL